MKIFKKFLKYWITFSSVTGFLLGWLFVSQSSELKFARAAAASAPVPTQVQVEATALPPVPSLNSLVGGDQQQSIQVQQFTVVQPPPAPPVIISQPRRLRTGSS